MLNRRHLPLLVTGACLLLASGAAAAVPGSFTVTVAPSAVKPQTAASYTVTLTNSPRPTSEREADRAKIGIPAGFTVDAASVQATTSAAETCVVATWVADGELISNGKINLERAGGASERLCPSGTLTVAFSATSAAAEGPMNGPRAASGRGRHGRVLRARRALDRPRRWYAAHGRYHGGSHQPEQFE